MVDGPAAWRPSGGGLRDGIYSFRFDAYGHLSRGSLVLAAGRASGGDTRVLIEGEFVRIGERVTASIEVAAAVAREGPADACTMLDFRLHLDGTGSDSHFDVIGVGPRGVIVLLTGEWMAPRSGS